MNKYESVIILKPNLSKGKLSEIISKIDAKISEFAKNIKKEDCGIRILAFEIKSNKAGHYFIYEFEVDENKKENLLNNLEDFYRITDEIIKYIIVKI